MGLRFYDQWQIESPRFISELFTQSVHIDQTMKIPQPHSLLTMEPIVHDGKLTGLYMYYIFFFFLGGGGKS